MPPRHYLRRLRNKPTPPIIIPQYYIYSNIFQEKPINNDQIQTQLFDIVDMISQRLEITEITTRVNNIVNNLSTPDELFELLNIVETISLSIVQNISDGVDIGIISTRIEYLRKLINDLPEGAIDDYANVADLILGVFKMITDGIDYTIVTDKLTSIKSTVDIYANRFDVLSEIQFMICSIVQNISDGVDIGIITTRIEYLNKLIIQLPEGVQDEYTKIGEIILDILGMITTGVDFTLISEKLNKIKTVTSVYDIVDEIKLLVCSIVQNISDGVDIGIITTRIEYLRNLIQKIPSEEI